VTRALANFGIGPLVPVFTRSEQRLRYDLADVPAECVKVDGRYLVRHPGAVAQLRYGVVVRERGTAIIITHAAALISPDQP
jgi:hypothetical protein